MPIHISLSSRWRAEVKTATVAAVFLLFVVMRAMDRAFLKRVQDYLTNTAYMSIMTNLYWPIAVQAPRLQAGTSSGMQLGLGLLLVGGKETECCAKFYVGKEDSGKP